MTPLPATLTRPQWNELYQIIGDIGLDPSAFQRREEQSRITNNLTVSLLIHESTGFYFLFDYHVLHRRRWVELRPGRKDPVERSRAESWTDVIRFFSIWLDSVRDEIQAPDMWKLFTEEAELLEAGLKFEETTEPFTGDEKQQILFRLEEVQRYLIEAQELSGEQRQYVEQRFDDLKESLARVGRRDWKYITIGVLFEISWRLALQPPVVRHLFAMLQALFTGDFHEIPF